MEFLQGLNSWWGLVVVVVAIAIYAIYDFSKAKKIIASMIFQAEERARGLALISGKTKFNWVKNNTYHLLPKWLRFVLSEEMYQALIQKVFDELKAWAKRQPLPK
ncbi:MAG: hypothetical protein QMD71_06230 [bacterium]|nr:hypothetical protein [bacterium]